MSEVIKDLAELAVRDSLFEPLYPAITVGEGDGQITIPVVFVEKFAKRIIDEAIQVMGAYHAEWLSKKLKKHFGVEE